MNVDAPRTIDSHAVYVVEEALEQHTRSVSEAKREWRRATHPRLMPSPRTIEEANERYRIAYNASLRNYLHAIRVLDERK